MDKIFTAIYETCEWGDNNNPTYKGSSGLGSDVNYNKDTYVQFLKKFIKIYKIKTVVDIGAGDFLCGNLIYGDLDVKYTGYEAYGKLVEYNKSIYPEPKYTFIHADAAATKESLVPADLCILKDILQHWDLASIYSFMDYIIASKKYKYILICNCCMQTRDNRDIETGSGRPLSCDYLPLKKYNAVKKMNYNTKEVSVIYLIDEVAAAAPL